MLTKKIHKISYPYKNYLNIFEMPNAYCKARLSVSNHFSKSSSAFTKLFFQNNNSRLRLFQSSYQYFPWYVYHSREKLNDKNIPRVQTLQLPFSVLSKSVQWNLRNQHSLLWRVPKVCKRPSQSLFISVFYP